MNQQGRPIGRESQIRDDFPGFFDAKGRGTSENVGRRILVIATIYVLGPYVSNPVPS
jgi:hypothetical protein